MRHGFHGFHGCQVGRAVPSAPPANQWDPCLPDPRPKTPSPIPNLLAALLLLLGGGTAGATQVIYSSQHFTGRALTNPVTLVPHPSTNAVIISGTNFVTGLPLTLYPDTNGFATTNLVPNNYKLTIRDITATIFVSIPDTNATLNLVSNTYGGTGTYTYTNNANFKTRVAEATATGYLGDLITVAGGLAKTTNGSGALVLSNSASGSGSVTNVTTAVPGLEFTGPTSNATLEVTNAASFRASIGAAAATNGTIVNPAILGGSMGLGTALYPLYFSNAAFSGIHREGSQTNTWDLVSAMQTNLQMSLSNTVAVMPFEAATLTSGSTNIIGALAGKVGIYTNSATLYVVPPPAGNDSTAQRGRPDKPWATLTNAWTNLVSGDTLVVYGGTNTISPVGVLNRTPEPPAAAMLLTNVSNVRITGVGNPIIKGDGPGNWILLQSCTNIFISGFTFQGNRPAIVTNPTAQLFMTIWMNGTNREIDIIGNRFLDMGNNTIGDLQDESFTKSTRYVRVLANYFQNCGGTNYNDGTIVQPGRSDWIVADNFATNVHRFVEFEGNYMAASSNHIVRNNIAYTDHFGISIYENSDSTNQYSNILISGNLLVGTGSTNAGMEIQGGSGIIIENNIVLDSEDGIDISILGHFTDSVVRNNTVSNTLDGGISLIRSATNFTLANNSITGNTLRRIGTSTGGPSIKVDSAINTVIEGNNVANPGGSDPLVRIYGTVAPTLGTTIRGNNLNGGALATHGVGIETNVQNTVITVNNMQSNVTANVSDLGVNTRHVLELISTNGLSLAHATNSQTLTFSNGVFYYNGTNLATLIGAAGDGVGIPTLNGTGTNTTFTNSTSNAALTVTGSASFSNTASFEVTRPFGGLGRNNFLARWSMTNGTGFNVSHFVMMTNGMFGNLGSSAGTSSGRTFFGTIQPGSSPSDFEGARSGFADNADSLLLFQNSIKRVHVVNGGAIKIASGGGFEVVNNTDSTATGAGVGWKMLATSGSTPVGAATNTMVIIQAGTTNPATALASNFLAWGMLLYTSGPPVGITNGLSLFWNSNGAATYLRTSTVGNTNEGVDTKLGPTP